MRTITSDKEGSKKMGKEVKNERKPDGETTRKSRYRQKDT